MVISYRNNDISCTHARPMLRTFQKKPENFWGGLNPLNPPFKYALGKYVHVAYMHEHPYEKILNIEQFCVFWFITMTMK